MHKSLSSVQPKQHDCHALLRPLNRGRVLRIHMLVWNCSCVNLHEKSFLFCRPIFLQGGLCGNQCLLIHYHSLQNLFPVFVSIHRNISGQQGHKRFMVVSIQVLCECESNSILYPLPLCPRYTSIFSPHDTWSKELPCAMCICKTLFS